LVKYAIIFLYKKKGAYFLKNKIVAGVFGILLGAFGIHKFYLGQVGYGILYLLFCWTGIPSIVGLIEGILYLVMSDEEFDAKYNKTNVTHIEDSE
jgi:TM2 domain-containing membrane protein YozV